MTRNCHLSVQQTSVFMITAGVGSGFVIVSGNQTLALQDVPVSEGGVAGSVMQVGQRAGTAIGTAIVAATYFATIYGKPTSEITVADYTIAFHNGLNLAIGLLLVALIRAARPQKVKKYPGRCTMNMTRSTDCAIRCSIYRYNRRKSRRPRATLTSDARPDDTTAN